MKPLILFAILALFILASGIAHAHHESYVHPGPRKPLHPQLVAASPNLEMHRQIEGFCTAPNDCRQFVEGVHTWEEFIRQTMDNGGKLVSVELEATVDFNANGVETTRDIYRAVFMIPLEGEMKPSMIFLVVVPEDEDLSSLQPAGQAV